MINVNDKVLRWCVSQVDAVESEQVAASQLQLLASAPESLVERTRCIIIAKARDTDSGPSGRDCTMLLFALAKDQVDPPSRANIDMLSSFHLRLHAQFQT